METPQQIVWLGGPAVLHLAWLDVHVAVEAHRGFLRVANELGGHHFGEGQHLAVWELRKAWTTDNASITQDSGRSFICTVDHLYTFFVQWSPEMYTKDNKKSRRPHYVVGDKKKTNNNKRYLVLEKDKIITVKDSKRRQSVCSSEGSEVGEVDEVGEDDFPVLCDHSHLLNDQHLERLAAQMPARTQGYPWHLAYSTAVHGTSLKTLYRNMAGLDNPVLLVIKDMQNKVFGAFSTEPFKVSDSCYGTGEMFLYSFGPDFKAYRWTGENSYFVRGHLESLQIGGGAGSFGLWLDDNLHRGASYSCPTFHNQPLSTQQDFLVQNIEVWTLQSEKGKGETV
ncbi:hypothetical protein CRUP_001521 [Coryphaenoides rupestris]|nr:hypothetical protein CRUP_001521 [Coryphaenoides rupestris]